MKKACVAVLLALCTLTGYGAEKKPWVKLEGCQYLAHKSNDGDSFLVQCGKEKFYVRFYYVDSPEADMTAADRVHQQSKYFGVTMDEVLVGGTRAREFVQSTLSQRPFVVHTKKAHAPGRAKTTRYYSLVQVDGRYLHEVLLSEGLARNKGTPTALPSGEKARAHVTALQFVEDRAREARKGLWKTHDPAKRQLNAPF